MMTPLDKSSNTDELDEGFDRPIREWALKFEKYVFSDPVTHAAIETLVKAGCNKVVIIELLHGARVQSPEDDEALNQWNTGTRRQANTLSRDMRRLANEMRSFHNSGAVLWIKEWPIGFRLLGAKKQVAPARIVEDLPSLLEGYAALLEGTWARQQFWERLELPTIEYVLLTSYVKGYTGKRHYGELCVLLNAIDSYSNSRTAKEWDPDAFRNQMNRCRRRYLAYAQRIDQLVTRYKSEYSTTPFNGRQFLSWLYKMQSEIPLVASGNP